MIGILFGLHIFTVGLVGSKVCVGFSAPPRWRSLLVSSCGVFEANRRVYAAFLETFPGWWEYVNRLVLFNPQSHNHATCMVTLLRDTHRGRSDDSGEVMQPVAMWNLAVADVLVGQRPSHLLQSVLYCLRIRTRRSPLAEAVCLPLQRRIDGELAAKEIEISKIPKSCSASYA